MWLPSFKPIGKSQGWFLIGSEGVIQDLGRKAKWLEKSPRMVVLVPWQSYIPGIQPGA